MLPGAIAVGNGAVAAGFLPGNNEPFILMTNNGYLVIAPLTDTNAHSVAIDKKELITK